MNRKQLAVTALLLSLMLILVTTQNFFEKNFKQVILIEKEIKNFNQYNFNENKNSISFPNGWIVEEKECLGNYVSNEINFKDQNNEVTGVFQLINTNGNLEVYAENQLNNQSLEYYNSEVTTFTNSNNSGTLLKYETSIRGGYDFKNECYYLNLEEGKIIKVLFNIKRDKYDQNIKIVINKIIESIKAC